MKINIGDKVVYKIADCVYGPFMVADLEHDGHILILDALSQDRSNIIGIPSAAVVKVIKRSWLAKNDD